MQKKKTQCRYVRSNKSCEFDFMTGSTAAQMLAWKKTECDWVDEFPIIYKLVPVSLDSVKRQAAREKAGRRAKQ